MQVGEPVASPASPPQDDPERAFEARIAEISFTDGIAACLQRAAIAAPHWKRGEESSIADEWSDMVKKLRLTCAATEFSKRAAVYVNGAGGPPHPEVQVKVEVTKAEGVAGTADLRGTLGSFSITGSFPASQGIQTAACRITRCPDGIQWFLGRMSWNASVGSAFASLGSTLVEVFMILGPPGPMYQDGPWIEALRFLCGRVGLCGVSSADAATSKVAEYCHSGHDVAYDTHGGVPSYGARLMGGEFWLDRYLRRKSREVNCYDQAAAVQVLCGCVGVPISWFGMRPYGLIRPTSLVGVPGSCNNPFFSATSSPPLITAQDPPEVQRRRTAFTNHAFCATSAGIVDACAGPQRGTRALDSYIAAAIDASSPLYGDQGWVQYGAGFGTSSDAHPSSGIDRLS